MLADALARLDRAVRATEFRLPTGERDRLLDLRERVARDLEGHAARLRDADAPLLVVLGGGTGAGKSTLLNSLAGDEISPVSVVRPTTSAPTLLLAPDDRPWFAGDRVLPALRRTEVSERAAGGRDVLYLSEGAGWPAGLALLDIPDIDSVELAHRALADLLLDAADVWLWCTTAQTYADDASMAYLRRAARRRTALGVVLNRVREQDVEAVVADLRAKLAAEGVPAVPLHVVGFRQDAGALLPADAVEPVRAWLFGLAEPDARRRLRRQTLAGALDALDDSIAPLIAAIEADWRVVRQLQDASDRAYRRAAPDFDAELDRGPPLSRAMLRRWADFVGTHRFVEFVETATGRLSGTLKRLRATIVSREEQHLDAQVREDLAERLAGTAVSVLDLAAARASEEWELIPAGASLLRDHPLLRRASAGLADDARAEVERWLADVDELIATRFTDRRGRARWMSGAVNAVATTAIVAAFAVSGGLTGAEFGIAGAAAVAQQAVLTKVLGERNLSWLLDEIRATLRTRVEALAAAERRRFTAAVADVSPDPDQADRLRDAVAAVQSARAAGEA